MIFGLSQLDITKDSPSLCWVVRNPETQGVVARVSFSYLFLWKDLLGSHYVDDLFGILEAGLSCSGWPSPEELGRMEERHPGVTSKDPFITPSSLDSLKKDWVVSSPKPKKKAKARKKDTTSLYGKRKYIL